MRTRLLLFAFLVLSLGAAPRENDPSVGYLFPAGGQVGTSFNLTLGGQFLGKATQVLISGQGVQATIVERCKPLRNLNKEQRVFLQRQYQKLWDRRMEERFGPDRPPRLRKPVFLKQVAMEGMEESMEAMEDPGQDLLASMEALQIPLHPLFHDSDSKDLRQLVHVQKSLFANRQMRQPNRQLAEILMLRVSIDADAEPGTRELRILTPTGLTAPRNFQVDTLPEISELEPNDRSANEPLPGLGLDSPEVAPLQVPVVLNGQILPGDVDRFRIRAQAGQSLVLQAQARGLLPYLADAVPGWFQATLALHDASGKEVAYADDFRFDPDPVLFYRIPEDGEYELAIHDSIYRGREDFVYRLRVSTEPFVTSVFPLGARQGSQSSVALTGWNLPRSAMDLDTSPGSLGLRHARVGALGFAGGFSYSLEDLPEVRESEPNDGPESAQPVSLPVLVNGQIQVRGDVDQFQFQGKKGGKVVVEVQARRLNSPLDSLVRILDSSQEVLAWNDDHVDKLSHLHRDTSGLVTHHADSYLSTELPRDGHYRVRISDVQGHGGLDHGYRLRISAPRPDFALRVTPSSVLARPGEFIPLRVHLLRRDGFDGAVQVALQEAEGFELQGGRIPPGMDRIFITLRAPHQVAQTGQVTEFSPRLVGRAQVRGQTLERPARAADDVMQAFLYRHLVPAEKLAVVVELSKHRAPPLRRAGKGPVSIPRGGGQEVHFRFPVKRGLEEFQLELMEPPPGISLGPLRATEKGASFEILVASDGPEAGFCDNLIVQVFREFQPKKNPKGKKKRRLVGFLPALPLMVRAP